MTAKILQFQRPDPKAKNPDSQVGARYGHSGFAVSSVDLALGMMSRVAKPILPIDWRKVKP
jgi:hypothetical protein